MQALSIGFLVEIVPETESNVDLPNGYKAPPGAVIQNAKKWFCKNSVVMEVHAPYMDRCNVVHSFGLNLDIRFAV